MMGVQRHPCSNKGFSILELLVVVGILAVIAGAVIVAYGPDFVNAKKITAARFEMQAIRDALEQFRRDNPGFEFSDINLCTPADVRYLHEPQYNDDAGECTVDSDDPVLQDYDVDYRLGWRGPYMSQGDTARVDISENLNHDGTGNPSSTPLQPDVLAIADPFVAQPLANGAFQWRQISADSSTNRDQLGRPYLFFDLRYLHSDPADDEDCPQNPAFSGSRPPCAPRIVSMGPDGRYDGRNNSDACVAEGDDLVLCIQ